MLERIVEQHALDAAFLWTRRDEACCAPHYRLSDLRGLDRRLEAHVDGLRVAGGQGWETCHAALDSEDPGTLFVAAVVAIERGDLRTIAYLLDYVEGNGALRRGLVSALGWVEKATFLALFEELLSPKAPAVLRELALGGCSAHRHDPGDALTMALSDQDASLRARALRTAGQLGRSDLLDVLEREAQSDDSTCAFWATWSTTLLGGRDGAGRLRHFADGPFGVPAAELALGHLSPDAAEEWLGHLRRNATRTALLVCPVRGNAGDVAWLIECMEEPEHARLAADAFRTITGIAIQGGLEAQPPEHRFGPTEDPDDDEVGGDPDLHLPWPNTDALRGLWRERSAEVDSHARLLWGRPAQETLRQAMQDGTQRERWRLAQEQAIAAPTTPLPETRAPGFRQ